MKGVARRSGEASGRVWAAALAFGAVGALAASGAGAELYRWRDPQSGAIQYSSVPPAWYKRGRGGPPVELIVEGRVVDQPAAAGAGVARPVAPAPATGVQTLPEIATAQQIAEVLVASLGLRESLARTSRIVENALASSTAWSRVSPQSREAALRAAQASFLPDKLAATMSVALAADMDAQLLRTYYEAMRQPIAQRMGALEMERLRMLAGPDGFQAPAAPSATSVRLALIEELERVANAAELAAIPVAVTQAAILGAVQRVTPVDVEYELERTKATVARELRPRLLVALQFVYEPASDEELREYIDFNRRAEVARVKPAIARAYGKAVSGGFREWFDALAPASRPGTTESQGATR